MSRATSGNGPDPSLGPPHKRSSRMAPPTDVNVSPTIDVLFRDVVKPSIAIGTRKWYTVPLSLTVHTVAVGALIIAPLMATGVLPMPSEKTTFMAVEPPPLPKPPVVRPRVVEPSPVRATAPPVVAPDGIAPEPARNFEQVETSSTIASAIPGVGELTADAIVAPPPPAAPPKPSGPVRVGGDVRAPQRVIATAPVYPAVALAARVQGVVIIEATIDTHGRVQAARVLRSNSPLLNESALNAVRQWVYTPTLLNGVPVSVLMTVTVQFRLDR